MNLANHLADGASIRVNDNPLTLIRREGNMIRTLTLDKDADGTALLTISNQHIEAGPDGPLIFNETFPLTADLLTSLADAATRLATD